MAASCPYFTSSNSPLPQNYPTPQSQVVLPSMPPAAPRRESNISNSAVPASEPAFFQGTVGSSSHDTVYIHARPPANEEQPVWVTTSWSGLMKELLAQEAVFHNLMDQLRSPTYANRRMQALRILGATVSQASIGGAALTEGVFGGFPGNSSPPAPDFRVDSPLFSSLPEDMSIWSAHRNSIDSSPMSAIPGTPMTSAFNDSDYYSTSPPEQEGALFNGDAPRILTASQDVIDPVILQERDSNEETQEFIWSPLECTLYSMDSMRAQTILKEPESVRLVFPPQTMMIAKEKDGVISTPAYTLTHPHSNEWIKAQVCHKHCAYRAGTTSLKRPKTVREHFQKCVWLESTHPLKVLASLQLAVLERESQGLLPRQRRGRVSVPISRLQPYQNTRGSAAAVKSSGAQLQLTNPFVRHTNEVFKEPAHENLQRSHQQQRPHPLSYNSSPEQQSMKLAPLGMYTGSARILPQATVHTSPSSSSLSGVSSFEASPRMR